MNSPNDKLSKIVDQYETERLKEINPSIKSNAFEYRLIRYDKKASKNEREEAGKGRSLFERGRKGKRYDIVFGCLDNVETRKLVQEYCTECKIPYVDGGTSPKAG